MSDTSEHPLDHDVPLEEHTCGHCGVTSTFGVIDDGLAVVWECPACEKRNITPGISAAQVAAKEAELNHARAVIAAHEAGLEPPVHVMAGDHVEAGDTNL